MSIKDKIGRGMQSWGLLAGAGVLGVVAFFASSRYLESKERQMEEMLAAQQETRVDVVVASTDINPGTVIGAQNMAIASVPVSNLSAAAVTPDQFGRFENKVLTARMSSGEPLLDHFVSGLGAERFSDLLQEGERAVTIPVDDLKSNDGMLTYGDRVDLLLLIKDQEASGQSESGQSLHPLLEDVRVLAVGKAALVSREADYTADQEFDGGELSYSTLTVGVNTEQAARLLLARDLGNVVVMLRNREDRGPLTASVLSGEALLGGNETAGSYEFISPSTAEAGTLKPRLRRIASSERDEVEVSEAAAPAAGVGAMAP